MKQETIVLGCTRRGDSEHCLNELQRWVWAATVSADSRDRHGTLRLLLQPPRILCASTGHYPHIPSWEPVQPATARVPWSRDNFPGRTNGVPPGCCNVSLASASAGSPHIPYPSLSPAWVSHNPLISNSFNLLLSGWRTDARGWHAEVGPNPKLNPKSCANKEEKGKFLHAASGTVD